MDVSKYSYQAEKILFQSKVDGGEYSGGTSSARKLKPQYSVRDESNSRKCELLRKNYCITDLKLPDAGLENERPIPELKAGLAGHEMFISDEQTGEFEAFLKTNFNNGEQVFGRTSTLKAVMSPIGNTTKYFKATKMLLNNSKYIICLDKAFDDIINTTPTNDMGFMLEQHLTTAIDDTDTPLNHRSSFRALICGTISHEAKSILVGLTGQVDAIWESKDPNGYELQLQDLVEVKHVQMNSLIKGRWFENAVLKGMWAQSRLMGITNCLFGTTNNQNTLRALWTLDVNNIPVALASTTARKGWPRAYPKGILETAADIEEAQAKCKPELWNSYTEFGRLYESLQTVINLFEKDPNTNVMYFSQAVEHHNNLTLTRIFKDTYEKAKNTEIRIIRTKQIIIKLQEKAVRIEDRANWVKKCLAQIHHKNTLSYNIWCLYTDDLYVKNIIVTFAKDWIRNKYCDFQASGKFEGVYTLHKGEEIEDEQYFALTDAK